MVLAGFFFYLFAAITVAAAFMVVAARNPVHAVLFLILTFFNSAGLFVLMGAEFLAMILVIVYVGAVAVLFLFVVMMLDIDFVELKQGFLNYLPFGGLVSAILLIELVLVLTSWVAVPDAAQSIAAPAGDIANTAAIGRVLYTQYVYFFQAAGMTLLVAMIGAIVLTLHHKPGVKRQNVADQVARTPATAIEIRKVESGKGI